MRQRKLFAFIVVVAAFLAVAPSLSAQGWAGRGNVGPRTWSRLF